MWPLLSSGLNVSSSFTAAPYAHDAGLSFPEDVSARIIRSRSTSTWSTPEHGINDQGEAGGLSGLFGNQVRPRAEFGIMTARDHRTFRGSDVRHLPL